MINPLDAYDTILERRKLGLTEIVSHNSLPIIFYVHHI